MRNTHMYLTPATIADPFTTAIVICKKAGTVSVNVQHVGTYADRQSGQTYCTYGQTVETDMLYIWTDS